MTDSQADSHNSEGQGNPPASGEAPGGEREEAIRQRAYEISQSEDAGTPEENWARAEREISGS